LGGDVERVLQFAHGGNSFRHYLYINLPSLC